MTPLLSGDLTGYSHPGCFASASEDCSTKLSKEHWLSDNIIDAAGDGKPVAVSGMPWQAGKEHSLRAANMGANILCDRHNRALSPLDGAAGQLFRVLRDYQADLRSDPEPHGHEFALFHGDAFERWMLKLFWGAIAAKALARGGVPIEGLRPDLDLRWLAAVLFRGEPMPAGWGLHMAGVPGVAFSGEAEVAMEPLTDPEGFLWAGVVEFGAVAFRFYLGEPSTAAAVHQRRPMGLFIQGADEATQKVIALAWDEGGSNPFVLTRLADGTAERRPSQI